ncbi:MAG: hypothetical protein FJ335_04120 [Sphingomonadales bacterium]|nr:hypothetical protein [Sphingomonadales bacterium]
MQIPGPRLPQTLPPARPIATNTRATVAALATALATEKTGDSVELSAAALAASDRLISGQAADAQQRAPTGDAPIPTTPLPRPEPADGSAVARAAVPRWETLPYAPQMLGPPPSPPPCAASASVGFFAKTLLIVGAIAVAMLSAVSLG